MEDDIATLRKIAFELGGMNYEDLTRVEKSIANHLVVSGYLVLEPNSEYPGPHTYRRCKIV